MGYLLCDDDVDDDVALESFSECEVELRDVFA